MCKNRVFIRYACGTLQQEQQQRSIASADFLAASVLQSLELAVALGSFLGFQGAARIAGIRKM